MTVSSLSQSQKFWQNQEIKAEAVAEIIRTRILERIVVPLPCLEYDPQKHNGILLFSMTLFWLAGYSISISLKFFFTLFEYRFICWEFCCVRSWTFNLWFLEI